MPSRSFSKYLNPPRPEERNSRISSLHHAVMLPPRGSLFKIVSWSEDSIIQKISDFINTPDPDIIVQPESGLQPCHILSLRNYTTTDY
ncbi:hypothetical protein TNIN_383361 [Trichonephila inaurata madagascariensis]|uniref:Uncharacterized protein n=1 Tax=Trichonephila inaurata madagascariensis TaxID=2747483 RepID=A0A8X6XGR1_9ARAC|nr:hypothetical protein TNIN_383361 [Trichonephila inaurata madagascariensis]